MSSMLCANLVERFMKALLVPGDTYPLFSSWIHAGTFNLSNLATIVLGLANIS